MAKPSVTVRMYKGILGDCFLVRAERDGRREHILIDCGVLQGVPGAPELMREIADDIVTATRDGGGRATIDLLIVTHEHWDHISGFGYARSIFLEPDSELDIKRLWLAWTENPEDAEARKLDARFNKLKMGIAAADAHARRFGDPDAELAGLDGLENFIGPIEDALAVSGGRLTGRKILDGLKAKADIVEYLEPGEVRTTPGPAQLRTYVLGPPRRADRLFNDLPREGSGKETYLDGVTLGAAAFAINIDRSDDRPPQERSPFAKRYRALHVSDVDKDLKVGALPEEWQALFRNYLRPDEKDRRIDHAWAEAAGEMALKLDSDTNNTSLVVAFELGDEAGTGDVLLFAADAQVGNWLSWHDQDYPQTARKNKAGVPGGVRISAEQLLSRTRLYKVGHHASHNATLRKRGLELMTSDGLVAMIPVVKKIADGKKGWHMPYADLLARLAEKTKGRVLRGDCRVGEGLDNLTQPDAEFIAEVAANETDRAVEIRIG